MSKQDTRTQELKQPRRVQLSVATPWVLIALMLAVFAGAVIGWTARSSQVSEVRSQVSYELSKSK